MSYDVQAPQICPGKEGIVKGATRFKVLMCEFLKWLRQSLNIPWGYRG